MGTLQPSPAEIKLVDLERTLQVEESKLLLMKRVRLHQRTHSVKKPKPKFTKPSQMSPKSQPPPKVRENKKTRTEHIKQNSSKYNDSSLRDLKNWEIIYDPETSQEKKELTDKINDTMYLLPKLVIPDVNGLVFIPSLDCNEYLESLATAHIKQVTSKGKSSSKQIFTPNDRSCVLKEAPVCPKCLKSCVRGWTLWKNSKICLDCYLVKAKEGCRVNYNTNLIPKLDKISSLRSKLDSMDKMAVVKNEQVPVKAAQPTPQPVPQTIPQTVTQTVPQTVPQTAPKPPVNQEFENSVQQCFTMLNDPMFIKNFMSNYFGMNVPAFSFQNLVPTTSQQNIPQTLMSNQNQCDILQKMFGQVKPNGT